MKNFLRKLLNTLNLDLTKNLEYDRLTRQVINRVVKNNSICVDVGCHKGEILDLILHNAPSGHFAFEPIPSYYDKLQKKYGEICTVLPYALGEHEGVSEFQFVKNAPAYSGIRKRKYNVETPEIEVLQVELKKLDDVIPASIKIDLIKIDVEGAEYQVMRGAQRIISRDKPVIIFECGIGASDYYGTNPAELFEFLNKLNFNISLLNSWLIDEPALTQQEFVNIYKKNKEYYFISYPA
ncbi:MAG: FkbM family methyltransferase [Bacteroidia bacterium]